MSSPDHLLHQSGAQSREAPPAARVANAPAFMQGGGEAGERMRAVEWQRTPLGDPSTWEQSLKTIVRVMLDSRYAMWMLWGPAKTFFCNDAYLPTVGIRRDWVMGERSDKVWEEIWADVAPRIEQVLTEGKATWDEGLLLYLERRGFPEETYHTFSYSPVYGDDGRIAGMLCVVTEVTDRVIGERRLRVLRDLAAPLEGPPSVEGSCLHSCEVLATYPLDIPFVALYLVDEATRVARKAASTGDPTSVLPDTLGLDDTASPWPVAAVVAQESAQPVDGLSALGFAIRAGPWPDDIRRARLLPIKASGHGLAGLMLVGLSPRQVDDDEYRTFLDLVAGHVAAALADAKAFEAERRRAEALAELDRAKTVFFSNVSHEFRTPLTLMLGPLDEALAATDTPPALRERLGLAQRSATRLQRLVNSLLDFSRIEAGRAQAKYESTDLALLTRDLASMFRSTMDKARLEFTVDAQPLSSPAFVDREMWEKIVLNLVSNAFKFTLHGRVAVRLLEDGGAAVLEVEDTGAGIPESELPRLFERFHRIETTQGRTHEGSGIGLALVQELVKLHGGTIEAESTLGRGTTMRVRIPLGRAHLAPERIDVQGAPKSNALARAFVDEATRWLPQDEASRTPVALSTGDTAADRRFESTFGARIVLADDNADMRSYVRDLLSPWYSVEAVADGVAALEAAHRQPPDLMLSDVMMPRLDGFGLVAAVRADPALRNVPVVLLSARAGEESRIEGLDSGADDYIVKPFVARELMARIGSLLELRRMRDSAERAARLRTAQLEALVDAAPLGVYLIDADFRIRAFNRTARTALGNMPDLLGRDYAEVMRSLRPRDEADEGIDIFRRTLATGEPHFVHERGYPTLDRTGVRFYEWQVNRIPLPDGRNGVVCYFRDITRPVHARIALEQADRQKNEFLAMLAHELRNPLAPIRTAGDILSRSPGLDGPAMRAVGILQRQITAVSRLVDDLLDVSRITEGRIDLQRRNIDLQDVVAQALEIVAPLVAEKHHALTTRIERPVRVDGDLARLVQCVANVLTNAAKYTDDGGEIRLEVTDDGHFATISVTDNGVGIPEALQPRIFDLFVQGDRTLDRAQGGLGIGLSLVRRLVEMHGGRVSVSSAGRGKGARFEIELPVVGEVEHVEDTAHVPAGVARRVLVVDDNADAVEALVMILSLEGHDVTSASSGEEALARAASFCPEVAILDIGLPGMSGYELARRLREMPAMKAAKLVALTGYGQSEDKVKTAEAGFDAHLVKPAELLALQQILAG